VTVLPVPSCVYQVPDLSVNCNCNAEAYTTTIPNVLAPGSMVQICVFTITEDMYGLGVRLGFYLQAFCNRVATILLVDGGVTGRSASATLAFGILVAFQLGLGTSSLSLEAPVFIALTSMISLPLLLEPALDKFRCERPENQGSLLLLGLIELIALMTTVGGFMQGWDRGPSHTREGIASGVDFRVKSLQKRSS
jgi:hypothetical protein